MGSGPPAQRCFAEGSSSVLMPGSCDRGEAYEGVAVERDPPPFVVVGGYRVLGADLSLRAEDSGR